jgi:multidrug efflux pump
VFTARIDRAFRTPEQFANLVISKGKADDVLIHLGDIARIEFGAEEDRNINRSNGQQTLGIGIVKQSTANVVKVAAEARARSAEIARSLPPGMSLDVQFDSSVFISASIHEVFVTLGIAVALVIGVIFLFLGSMRATIVPAVTVPISLIATFTVLYALGLSINLLTLLALVLAIGLVVDDAIVVLENIHRRIEEEGESPLVAAFRGTRQVGFAVVATTLVLISVFVPITFMQGQMGRLFAEFAIAIAAAVAFSMLVALTISPMLASKLMKPHNADAKKGGLMSRVDKIFAGLRRGYGVIYDATVRRPIAIAIVFFAIMGGSWYLFTAIPSEYTPNEDRGQLMVMITAQDAKPTITLPANVTGYENIPTPIVGVSIADVDDRLAPGMHVLLNVSVATGSLNFPSYTPTLPGGPPNPLVINVTNLTPSNMSQHVTLYGSIADINAALASIAASAPRTLSADSATMPGFCAMRFAAEIGAAAGAV